MEGVLLLLKMVFSGGKVVGLRWCYDDDGGWLGYGASGGSRYYMGC